MSVPQDRVPSEQTETLSESSSSKATGEAASSSGATGGSSRDISSGTPHDVPGSSGSGGDGGRGRKRRAAGTVSLMACTPCRQARQRCDGQRPESCGRCLQRKLHCVYEPHTKTHKDDLVREIEALRGDNTGLQNRNREIEDLAAENDSMNQSLRKEGTWQRIILQTIGNDGHDREIINKLRAGESHRTIADWLVREDPSLFQRIRPSLQPVTSRKLEDVVKLFESQYQEQGTLHSPDAAAHQVPWTKVTTNHELISHLLNLYFTWVHPVHMLLSELAFKQDFQSGQHSHCSASLVNAVCAMGCNLIEHGHDPWSDLDVATLRDGFMKEARSYLLPESFRHLTSLQAFAVMTLVELSCGKARKAVGYMRSAIDNIKNQDHRQQSKEAEEVTTLGIQTLNSVLAGMTYQKFYTPPSPARPIFEHVRPDRGDAVWQFYRRLGDEREMPTRSSHATVTAYHQIRLFRIVNETLNLYCGSHGKISAFKVLDVYQGYLRWKESLPAVIANITEGDQPLPHVLYLHVQYHTALVQLFRPLVHSGFFVDDDQAELKRILVFHARSGVEPLGHAQRLYSARYFLPLVSFCLVHLCDALLSYAHQEPPASETLAFCLQALQSSRAGFALCGPLQSLFLRRAEECDVQLARHQEKLVDSIDEYTLDDILDACTRLSYLEPLDQIVQYIDPAIAQEWHSEWEIQIIGLKQNRDHLHIGDILNE